MASPSFKDLTDTSTIEEIQEVIRAERASCFEVINRGLIWYETITASQKAELVEWYQAWLDAPETLIIPEEPTWISERMNPQQTKEKDELLYLALKQLGLINQRK